MHHDTFCLPHVPCKNTMCNYPSAQLVHSQVIFQVWLAHTYIPFLSFHFYLFFKGKKKKEQEGWRRGVRTVPGEIAELSFSGLSTFPAWLHQDSQAPDLKLDWAEALGDSRGSWDTAGMLWVYKKGSICKSKTSPSQNRSQFVLKKVASAKWLWTKKCLQMALVKHHLSTIIREIIQFASWQYPCMFGMLKISWQITPGCWDLKIFEVKVFPWAQPKAWRVQEQQPRAGQRAGHKPGPLPPGQELLPALGELSPWRALRKSL